MPFPLFIKSPPAAHWATSIITIFFMYHQKLFECPVLERAFDSNRWHRAGEGQDTQSSYCLVHWASTDGISSSYYKQAASPSSELTERWAQWCSVPILCLQRNWKERGKRWVDLPRTVRVSRRFLNIFEQILAHLDWGLASMGSRWLSCILTSTCLGILLALYQRGKK